MSKHLISRIIMLPDGSAHIALKDRHTVQCTPQNVSELLSDPYGYIDEIQYNYQPSTRTVNPDGDSLENIKGLTLLKIYSDVEIVCVFPKLFHALFSNINKNSNDPLNLMDVVSNLAFSDEKHFLMKFFFDFTNEPRSQLLVHRKLGLDINIQSEIMLETFNTIFSRVAPDDDFCDQKDPDNDNTSKIPLFAQPPGYMDDTVSAAEFAQMHNVTLSTVYTWKKEGKLRGAEIVNGRIRINRNAEVPEDRRAKRRMPPKSQAGLKKYSSDLTKYEQLQAYIRDNNILSPETASFIRTHEELRFYQTNRYHEVCWDGKRALIIDINPEYYCETLHMTNRQLITQGKSPRVPQREEYEFHIHHIGQRPDSPFAIIPKDIHLSNFEIFHISIGTDHANTSPNLHDDNFAIQKRSFWKKYLSEYDKYGSFQDIPCSSLKVKADKKK